MRSGREVIEMALRRIGVVAQDESATNEQYADARAILDGLSAEIDREAPMPWAVAAGVPDYAFNPLWMLLAVDLAGFYAVATPELRGRAMTRVLATVRQYTPYNCDCRSYPCSCLMTDYH